MPAQKSYIEEIAQKARAVSYEISSRGTGEKNALLNSIADELSENHDLILEANKKDVFALNAEKGKAFLDRLKLDDKRIEAMVTTIRDIAAQPDPIGSGNWINKRPNGLKIMKIRIPIGVVAIIYESRPNVTSDIAAMTLKTGNSVILRGGKESIHTNCAIVGLIHDAMKKNNFPEDSVQFIEKTDYEHAAELLKQSNCIDVVIPRGGEKLIKFVEEHSKIPVIKHDKGICHIYVDEIADKVKAENITINAKVQKPSVCNAAETLLIHKKYPHAKSLIQALLDKEVEVVGDAGVLQMFKALKPATEEDWFTEYLDLKISVKMVDGVGEAINHINRYGSHHSDAIVSECYDNIQLFLDRVDSAAVYANASTRFTDGGEFGLGAEVGISTQKIHVRGPMGLEGLTTEKWVVYGDGQVRE
ncbi:MAG: glutamate-5-semialdehyde dehydrogenase [Brevinematales bacterium]|jgi:glutamate-5-semialdehyde dehydrogenase